jgi:hypothetical protein
MEDLMAVARWMAAQRTALTPLWAVLVLSLAGLAERYLIDTAPLWQRAALIVLGAAPPLIFASRLAKWWWRWWDVTLTVAGAAWVVWVGLLATDRWGMALGALVAFGLAMFTGRLLNTDLKAKVTVEGEFRDWPEKAKRIGYPDITWVNHKVVPGQGWTAKLVWPAGAYDRDRVVKDVHRFEGARDLPVGSLRLLFHGKSRNSVDAIYVQDDRTTVAVEWPGPTGDHLSAADPVRVGRRADETEVTVARYLPDVGERRILLGGSSGSGKSEMIHNFVGEDAVRDDVVGLGMDLKGGVELGLWDDVLLWMIHDIEGAMQMLAALEAAAVYRQGVLRGRKLRVWRVSPTLPVIHVTVDEIRRLAGSQSGRTGKQQRILLDRLIDVATQGRNVGIGLLAAGQLLTLEALGTSQIRSQFDVRIGLRMNEEESAHYVFPDDVVRLHEIDENAPGTGYLKDGMTLDRQPFRGYRWPEQLVRQVAALRAGGGAELDQGTGDAMAAASEMFAAVWQAAGRMGPVGDTGGDTGGDTAGDTAGDDEYDEHGDTAGDTAGTSGRDRDTAMEDLSLLGDGPDVSLRDIVARRAARTGITPPTVLVPRRPERRLNQAEAVAAVRRMLAEAGPAGVRPRDLYTAAGRSSSWLFELAKRWTDEGTLTRTADGLYADPRAVAGPRAVPDTASTDTVPSHAQ